MLKLSSIPFTIQLALAAYNLASLPDDTDDNHSVFWLSEFNALLAVLGLMVCILGHIASWLANRAVMNM